MDTRTRIAVAGATGRLGPHIVDVLAERGHEVVPMSRSLGIDVVSGEGLAEALAGVETVIDAASHPTPEQGPATEFFLASSRNLQEIGAQAGVQRIVVVSIIGIDRFSAGFLAAKKVHEQAMLASPIPVRILRAAQFHEFVEPLLEWARQENGVRYVPNMQTQLVAARTVAEALADLATDTEAAAPATGAAPFPEIAGPRAETLVGVASLVAARRGEKVRVEGFTDPADPDRDAYANGGLLPGADAILAGPSYEEWLDSEVRK
ncbi:MAG TPA: NAD(P)H-binding protein [Gaiella sp.]|uniref:SDR family oxidoreductase n=1 Tax=Gaiella sp. TaxID=2663207 RepID=UPI002D7F21C3|nr:NAD(P)H-binding protein [Gaiella sp.]HET9286669.1 NAD(P)H-binding protein [Gaiella sp.]